MKVYNLSGYSLLILHILVSALAAPAGWSIGLAITVGLIYLLMIWFFGGVYLSDVLHMGIAHKTLSYKKWFVQALTLSYSTAGIWVNPTEWVNRHRHHHAFSDHAGDPNKLASDGFWRTLYLSFFPYKCKSNLAADAILKTLPFRLVSNPYFAIFSQFSSFAVIWLVVRDIKYALVLWWGGRFLAIWVNMLQNYWTHDRRFGSRRYADEKDNAMNLSEWLPVTATFSSSLQNNHHHFPNFLRNSHEQDEYDFGFMTVRALKALGLVKPTAVGARIPKGISLEQVGL
jgi:stearoyl-CoA desaturase (delta-9 desaturase)